MFYDILDKPRSEILPFFKPFIEDIACMKLSAVVSRAVEKDFVDLYFIIKNLPLGRLLEKMKQKMPDLDQNLVLKSLVYFDDIVEEKIIFKHGNEVSLKNIKKFLEIQVKEISLSGSKRQN